MIKLFSTTFFFFLVFFSVLHSQVYYEADPFRLLSYEKSYFV
ncbi:uncharacterized protein METZ01_LOCUS445382, partial [marine metagenome]